MEPDLAIVNIGVEVTAETVAEARSEAADAMDRVRETLDDNDIEEADVRTQFFNIYPQFSFEDERPEIIAFTVSNQIAVKVRDIDNVSNVLDDAIEAGGDAIRVNGVSFSVDEPEQFLEEAREMAMEDARQRAEHLATLGGVELGKPVSISESSGGGIPAPATGFGGEAAFDGATRISPGEADVVLQVFVQYEID